MSINLEQISKVYGEQKALNEVSVKIKKGEIVALLGPNGAGKSTMMKIISCFLPQSQGEAYVCGLNVVNQPLQVKAKLGYLPENNPLYPDMYVREYLEFVAGIHKLGKQTHERVNNIIKRTGLTPEHHKKIGALSKGYRQRVGIAQALIHDPEVLILDEPTSGLDPNQLVDIRNLIKEVGKEKTVLLSTHIMQEVEAVCERVIIINKGNIVADAPTRELQMLHKTRKIIHVEFNQETDIQQLRDIEGVVEVVNTDKNSYKIFVESKKDVRPDIFYLAVQQNLIILSMGYEDQSMEQVFRDLTFAE